MRTDRELMQMALEALEMESKGYSEKHRRLWPIICALTERLKQVGDEEPVAWAFSDDPKVFAMPGSGVRVGKEPPEHAINLTPLYTAPPEAQPCPTCEAHAVATALRQRLNRPEKTGHALMQEVVDTYRSGGSYAERHNRMVPLIEEIAERLERSEYDLWKEHPYTKAFMKSLEIERGNRFVFTLIPD